MSARKPKTKPAKSFPPAVQEFTFDVDVICREDGLWQVDAFFGGPAGVTCYGDTEEEAMELLRLALEQERIDWNKWRRRRANLPKFQFRVVYKQVTLKLSVSSLNGFGY